MKYKERCKRSWGRSLQLDAKLKRKGESFLIKRQQGERMACLCWCVRACGGGEVWVWMRWLFALRSPGRPIEKENKK